MSEISERQLSHRHRHATQDAPDTLPDLASAWGVNVEAAVCEHCDWSYLLPQGTLPLDCPRCFQAELTPLRDQVENLPHSRPPELLLPFTVSAETLNRRMPRS